MAVLDRLSMLTSVAFRLAAYIFLRIIPSPIFKFVLPALYATYATSFLFTVNSHALSRAENSGAVGKGKVANGVLERSRASVAGSIRAVLFSSPNASMKLRTLSFCVNSILLLFAIDFITHPVRCPANDVTYARVGAVDHQSVKITVRYPHANVNESSVRLVYREWNDSLDSNHPWLNGPIFHLSEVDDWVTTRRVSALSSNTTYQYRLTSTESILPYPSQPLTFKTFPDPRLLHGERFKFLATSCMLPNFPYVPGRGNSIKGFELLHNTLRVHSNVTDGTAYPDLARTAFDNAKRVLEKLNVPLRNEFNPRDVLAPAANIPPEFLLFLGDFIYADVPVYFGNDLEAYRRLYRRVYASQEFREVYHTLPIMHIYDDHEIINNFAGGSDASHQFGLNATQAYQSYNGDANYAPIEQGEHYYSFRHGDTAFFVMDTRLHRSLASHSDEDSKSMLGEIQLTALRTWLAETNNTAVYKFIVSSVPFTSLWQHDAQVDSWAAFPEEKEQLLQLFHTVPNVFIISGDRHEFAVIEFNGPHNWSHVVREVSTSPLSMFYIPLIRTLNMESAARVRRTQPFSSSAEANETYLETYTLPKERVTKYLPNGNHKWAEFSVDTRMQEKPSLHLEVVINGRSAYREQFEGIEVKLAKSMGLSIFKPQNFQEILGKIGMTSRNWF